MTGIRWILFAFCASCFGLEAQTGPRDTLENARAYRVVFPEKTLSLLIAQQAQWQQLNVADQFEWLHIKFSAAQHLANLALMERTLSQMVAHHQHYPEAGFVSDVLNAQGIWLRRSGNLHEARLNYLCSIEQSSTPGQRLRSALNLGSVERNLGNYARAKEINRAALKMAHALGSEKQIASIKNNLGLVYLNLGETDKAIAHLSSAMDINTKLARRSSELLNGINLLNAFVHAQKWALYERLYPRVERILIAHPNPARSAYLLWVNAAFRASIGLLPTEEEITELHHQFTQVNDSGVQKLVLSLVADTPLTPPPAELAAPVSLQLSKLPALPQCKWEKYEKLGYAHILSTVKAENDG